MDGDHQQRRSRGAPEIRVVVDSLGRRRSLACRAFHAPLVRLGTLYLRIVGPAYVCFGLGLALFYVTQSVGRGVAAMNANAVRMMTSAGCGLVAVYLLDLGVAGFFAAVAAGFCVYAALLVRAVFGVRAPDAALVTNS